MFQFSENHLRVSKPVTTDGVNLALDSEGKRKMKTVHLPKSAKPYIELRNKKLPDNLKIKIEEIPGYTPAPVNNEVEILKAKIAELEAEKNKKPVKNEKAES